MNLGDNSFLEFAEKHTIFFCCHLERSERSQATERYSKRCLALLNMIKTDLFMKIIIDSLKHQTSRLFQRKTIM